MVFDINKAVQILGRTPSALVFQLSDLDNDWTHANEGTNTWSPFGVVGHLIYGEKVDWIPRAKMILESNNGEIYFPTFDRSGHFKEIEGKSLNQLLIEFKEIRQKNISELLTWNLSETDLEKTGIHPELGSVSLRQLLSTWVVHDLVHQAQINRVLAKQYRAEIGPWKEFISFFRI